MAERNINKFVLDAAQKDIPACSRADILGSVNGPAKKTGQKDSLAL